MCIWNSVDKNKYGLRLFLLLATLRLSSILATHHWLWRLATNVSGETIQASLPTSASKSNSQFGFQRFPYLCLKIMLVHNIDIVIWVIASYNVTLKSSTLLSKNQIHWYRFDMIKFLRFGSNCPPRWSQSMSINQSINTESCMVPKIVSIFQFSEEYLNSSHVH